MLIPEKCYFLLPAKPRIPEKRQKLLPVATRRQGWQQTVFITAVRRSIPGPKPGHLPQSRLDRGPYHQPR